MSLVVKKDILYTLVPWYLGLSSLVQLLPSEKNGISYLITAACRVPQDCCYGLSIPFTAFSTETASEFRVILLGKSSTFRNGVLFVVTVSRPLVVWLFFNSAADSAG